MKRIRGVFRVNMISLTSDYQGGHNETVDLSPVSTKDPIPDAEKFHAATPTGSCSLTITNKGAQGRLKLGEYYFLDLTPVKQGQDEAR